MTKENTLCKASISLSNLVGVSVCTYWGGLRSLFEDDLGRELQEDLKEITIDGKVNVEGIG